MDFQLNFYCVKSNTMGAAKAMVVAELALAGIESIIPVYEVIGAMKSVGKPMPPVPEETVR